MAGCCRSDAVQNDDVENSREGESQPTPTNDSAVPRAADRITCLTLQNWRASAHINHLPPAAVVVLMYHVTTNTLERFTSGYG